MAESGINRKPINEEKDAEILGKLRPSPILWELFKDSTPTRTVVDKYTDIENYVIPCLKAHPAIEHSFQICSLRLCQQLCVVKKDHRQTCVRCWELGS
jgi:hypothetical protein